MENTHIVARFDKDLAKIKSRILTMGELVLCQIEGASQALLDQNTDEVDAIVATDRKINGMNATIHTRAERLIAMRQPMALDLREALSPIAIAGELERIGDHAKSTAKRVRKLKPGTIPNELLEMIGQMSAIVQTQLADVLAAYANSDIEQSAIVRQRDAQIDLLNNEVFAKGAQLLSGVEDNAETLLHVILIARNFERVGDHVVNMARHVHQIVTGVDPKAIDNSDRS